MAKTKIFEIELQSYHFISRLKPPSELNIPQIYPYLFFDTSIVIVNLYMLMQIHPYITVDYFLKNSK
jgi:hypothetical protein